MTLVYYFYNPKTRGEDEYEWECTDNVFNSLVDYYVENHNATYDEAWDLLVDDDELRERMFYEVYDGLKDEFESEAYNSYLEEVVYSW